jgi:hypothetical protein
MAFHTIFLGSCSGAVSLKMNGPTAAVQGITFAAERGEIYIPIDEATRRLNLRILYPVHCQTSRKLVDGTPLVSLKELTEKGVKVIRTESGKFARVSRFIRSFDIMVGAKYTEINLTEQKLRAWQGKRLVLETQISSGKPGHRTPKGDFHAGPYKARMHHSTLYDNAPMPWSVEVTGNIFIHGFFSVPDYPASHGCIRLPISGGNPAKFFYDWVNVGTPISIHD